MKQTSERMRKELVDKICKDLVDQGKLLESGWRGLLLTVIPLDASEIQKREMRMAFYAGAQHLFGSIMGILDPGTEPTENDMRRMEAINEELNTFIKEFKLRYN